MIRLILLAVLFLAGFGDSVYAGEATPDSTQGAVSPRGALVRSMVLPGWGQVYNGRPIKGSLFAAAEIGSVVAFFVRRNQLNGRPPTVGQRERNVYLFTSMGIVLLSMADAYVDAHLDSVDWGKVEVGPDEKGEMKVKLSVRF